MNVKILVENTCCRDCQAEHGLSILVAYKGKEYLIDTGASSLFSENAVKMGVDLGKVKSAFLSHAHFDHSGGYPAFFDQNDTARVYLQETSKRKQYFKICGPVKKYIGIPEGVLDRYPDRFEYVKGYAEIEDGIYILPHNTEGLIERAKRTHMCSLVGDKVEYDDFSHEQTVVFEEEDGLVCFNSCSHAGVDVIIDEVKKAFPEKKIKAFFGGFHMMGIKGVETCSYSKEEVQAVAKTLLTSSEADFYSGHCTGFIAFDWLKEVLGDRLAAMASGKTFEV